MAIEIVRGPAGAGKSQWIAERLTDSTVVIDFTRIYAALAGVERGPDGRYPVRTGRDVRIPLTMATKEFVLREAARRGLNGYVTTSDSSDGVLRDLRRDGADGEIHTIVLPRATLAARLADPLTGELSGECESALSRWFR